MAPANRTARRELAVLLAAFAAWAATEGWIRVKAWRSGVQPFRLAVPARMTVSDRDLPHAGTPFLDVWSHAPTQDGQYVRIRHDGLGFRSPPVAVPKPPGVYRVVLMGDCTMYESGTGTPEGYGPCAERLRALLETSRGGTVEVVNAAMGGYDQLTVAAQYLFKIRPLQPDLLIVEPELFEVPNRPRRPDSARNAYDAPPLVKARFQAWRSSLALSRLETDWAPALDLRFRSLLEGASRGPVPSPDHSHWTREVCGALGSLASLVRHDGTRILVQPPPTWLRGHPDGPAEQARQVADMDRAVSEWARREGVPLVVASRLPGRPEDFLAVDGIPSLFLLTRRGQERRAEVLAEAVP